LGEAFIVDFSHASESRSRKEKAQEVEELSRILGMKTPTKPAAEAVEKPILRRSARIEDLERKVKVQTKNVQVKCRKAICRK
jgi:predicted HAD superfamily Cof-like phosphohydrolase